MYIIESNDQNKYLLTGVMCNEINGILLIFNIDCNVNYPLSISFSRIKLMFLVLFFFLINDATYVSSYDLFSLCYIEPVVNCFLWFIFHLTINFFGTIETG